MRTIVLFSALAAGLSPAPTLLAQTPAPMALISSPLHIAVPAAAEAFASLPEAPVPAVTAGPALLSTRPCRTSSAFRSGPDADSADQDREPCLESPNPYHRFLDTAVPVPLTPQQKAHLAFHNLKDPGNLATILGTAGFTVGTNSHTAYGPGWTGFRRMTGYSFLQDATAEFFGTFLVSSFTHEDPHYRRIPEASIPRRALHAIAGTIIAQSDEGRRMPNYANLLTIPICTEISNLYVPGVNGNGPSTVARIMTGYATDPADNLITEFLPDLAKHIHVRVIFVQSILNQVSNEQYSLP
jgi:hypothetical protein